MIDEKWLDGFSEKHHYNKEKYGGNNFSLIIIGESHGTTRIPEIERPQQDEVIEKFKPAYILIETLNSHIDDGYFKKWQKNHKLEPCDLSPDEKENIRTKLGFYILGNFDESGQPKKEIKQSLDSAREMKMGEIIISKSEKTSKPLVAIIGNNHAKKNSKIHNVLARKDYIVLLQKETV